MNNSIFIQPQNHDVTCTFVDDNNNIRTFEYDRWKNKKWCRLHFYESPGRDKTTQNQLIEESIINLIEFLTYTKTFKKKEPVTKCFILMNGLSDDLNRGCTRAELLCNTISKVFPNTDMYFHPYHHYAHAAVAYYQSPKQFEKSLIFSYDGSGFTSLKRKEFNVRNVETFMNKAAPLWRTGLLFYGYNYNKPIKYITSKCLHYGGVYTEISKNIKINWPGGSRRTLSKVNKRLSSPGKFMGYTGYGKPIPNLVERYKDFILNKSDNNQPIYALRTRNTKKFNNQRPWKETKKELIRYIEKIPKDEVENHAASFQLAFEEAIIEIIIPIVQKHKLPLILTGGCALNVLVNQRITKICKQMGLDTFVCNNPSDSGLSLGQLFLEFPHHNQSLTYSGLPMMDDIQPYFEKYNIKEKTIAQLVQKIKDGYIIGCANDNSELGPRALGNRSIICKPDPGMKDKLNSKIKFREWFRPFAPVCRLQDKDKFFIDAYESPYMTLSPIVRKKYRDQLVSITHVDGSARLQTVTNEQNSFLYELLTEMENQNLLPVILNTSFNIKGKPILTTYDSAFEALEETQLDYIFLDKKYLISKEDKL